MRHSLTGCVVKVKEWMNQTKVPSPSCDIDPVRSWPWHCLEYTNFCSLKYDSLYILSYHNQSRLCLSAWYWQPSSLRSLCPALPVFKKCTPWVADTNMFEIWKSWNSRAPDVDYNGISTLTDIRNKRDKQGLALFFSYLIDQLRFVGLSGKIKTLEFNLSSNCYFSCHLLHFEEQCPEFRI